MRKYNKFIEEYVINRNLPVFFLGCFFILVGSIVPLAVFSYLQREDPAYLWDWGAYFGMYQHFGDLIRNQDQWMRDLLRSVSEDDYNLLPISFLAPFSIVFHDSRFGYICGISIFYLIPAAFMLAICSISSKGYSNFSLEESRGISYFLVCFVVSLEFHPFWIPTLRGLPDVAGIIPLGLASLVLMKSKFLSRFSWLSIVLFSIMAWLTFAMRRWYAFSVVSMISISFFITFLYALKSLDRRKAFINFFLSYTVSGFIISALLFLFQKSLVVRILSTSYQEAYIAYQKPFSISLQIMENIYGIFYTILFVFGLLLSIKNKNVSVIFCALSAILTFLLFTRTQAPGIQHGLPIFFWATIVGIYFILNIASVLHPIARLVLAIGIIAYGFAASAIVFFPIMQSNLGNFAFILPAQRVPPLHVENMNEYRNMISKIKEFTNNGSRFSVFASSPVLADSLLVAFDHSLETNLNGASQVDARDFMSLAPLTSAYVVVTDKPITHLNSGSQQVIEIPNNDIMQNQHMGEAYQRVAGPYSLSDGNRAYIYHRIRPLSDEDIEDLQSQLNKSYPTWKWNHNGMIQ